MPTCAPRQSVLQLFSGLGGHGENVWRSKETVQSSKHVKAFKNKPVCSNRAAKANIFCQFEVQRTKGSQLSRLSLPSLIYRFLAFFFYFAFKPTQTLRFIKLPRLRPDRLMAKHDSSRSDSDPSTWGGEGVDLHNSLSELRAVVLGDPAVICGRWDVLELGIPGGGKATSLTDNQTSLINHTLHLHNWI